jgi:hypothetical protein
MLLRGTAAELDEGFFAAIEEPVRATAQLFANMGQYLKSQEQARLNSQMEKENATKADKLKVEREKKYTDAMKRADELEADKKYREAWVKVPEAADHPEHADDIRQRKSALAKMFPPDLFNDNAKTTEPC